MFHVSLEDSGVHGGGLFLPLPVFLCQSKEKPDLFSWGVGGLFLPLPMFFALVYRDTKERGSVSFADTLSFPVD